MDQPPKHPKVARIFAELLAALDTTATKLARDISRPDEGEEYKQQTISNYVAGKYLPGQEILAAIAREYPAIDYKWLITGEGEPFPYGRYNEKAAPKASALPSSVGEGKIAERVVGPADPPTMAIIKELEAMTPDEQIAYLKVLLGMAEEELAGYKNAERHKTAVRLMKTVGGQSFTSASPEAADTYKLATMAVSYRNPDLPMPQRFVPQPAEQPRRIVVGGFGS